MTVAGTTIRPRRDLAEAVAKHARAQRDDESAEVEEILGDGTTTASLLASRPKTRADCEQVPRPCPYVGCRYHVYLEVTRSGKSIHLLQPDLEVWELPPHSSCVLDVIDASRRKSAGGERVGVAAGRTAEVLGISLDRVKQIQRSGLAKLKQHGKLLLRLQPTDDAGYRVHLPAFGAGDEDTDP